MRPAATLSVSATIIASVVGQSLPYNPTSIYLSSANPNIAYVFLPRNSPSSTTQFGTIDISSTIDASNIIYNTLSSALPFENADIWGNDTAFLPYISSSGSIGVYSGNCSAQGTFWMFTPDHESSKSSNGSSGNGTWNRVPLENTDALTSSSLISANFLASAFSFSTYVDSNDTQRSIYVFGGMCPINASSTSSSWQSSATYSNNMLKISPSLNSQSSYDLSLTGAYGNRPIAEAGFTVTGLMPTYSNSSGSLNPQAQNFVLIGGHTRDAFTNMSLVALFSLPQESWTFQGIDAPGAGGTTELALKSSAPNPPDSRSGHTAILSADGSSIIIFGGWVGDIETPADPQLAILRVASGFGGSGDWQWEIPTASGVGLSSGEGIYGHGAIILPGDIMMVIGGCRISAQNSQKAKRTDTSNTALLFNISSLSWITEYTNPTNIGVASESSGSATAANKSKNKKVGLGVGLGLGLFLILSALVAYVLYSKRQNGRHRAKREKYISDLSHISGDSVDPDMTDENREFWRRTRSDTFMNQESSLLPGAPSGSLGTRAMGRSNSGNSVHAPLVYTPSGGRDDDEIHNVSSIRTVPSPLERSNSFPRKPISARNARGYYQPAPPRPSNDWMHHRSNSLGTSGAIHPIYETDEEEGNLYDDSSATQDPLNLGSSIHEPKAEKSLGGNVENLILPSRSEIRHPIQGSRAHQIIQESTMDNAFGIQMPVKELAPSIMSDSNTQSLSRRSPSPQSALEELDREYRDWMDWSKEGAFFDTRSGAQSALSGRESPSKENTGRTESNLSEKSYTWSVPGLSRNNSILQKGNALAALFGTGGIWNPFAASASGYDTDLTTGNGHRRGDISPVSHSSSDKPPPSSGSGTSSFNTAHSTLSFSQMKAEGENLLPRPRQYSHIPDEPGSPSKSKPLRRGAQQNGLLGTLKRVFSGNELRKSSTTSNPKSRRNRSDSLGEISERPEMSMSSRYAEGIAQPRRTMSAAAAPWRPRQGREDWEDSPNLSISKRSNTGTLASSLETYGDDWIEEAAERRQVQIMFTIPREKLRVVNVDVPGEDKSVTESIFDTVNAHTADQNGKGRAVESVIASEILATSTPSSPSPSRPGSPGKVKGRVQEIVEQMENRSS